MIIFHPNFEVSMNAHSKPRETKTCDIYLRKLGDRLEQQIGTEAGYFFEKKLSPIEE